MVRHSIEAANRWRDGQSIDARDEMTRLTLHIVAEALFGAALGPEVDAISNAMDYNVRAFIRMTTRLGALLAFLPTPFTIRYLMSRRKVLLMPRRSVWNPASLCVQAARSNCASPNGDPAYRANRFSGR